ncbi:MAG: InlB B-repeat-containing protein [Clostridia bacterium]|nr:InlB B-repeat-containing protein [Clostridia bacterium]
MTKTNFIVSFFAVIACLFACTPFACVYSTPAGAESAVYTISYLDSKTQQSIDTTNSTTITSDILPYYLTKPTQNKTGYNFDYWGYDRVNPLSYDETNDAYYIKAADLSIAQNNSLEIIAYWTPIEYALTFVYDISGVVDPVNFYTAEDKSYNIEDEIDFAQKDNQPRKNGYEFVGWYRESAFENKVEAINAGNTGDITLYAKFTKLDLVITFADEEFEPIHFEFGVYAYDKNGQEGVLQDKTPTKEGYTFEGWYTNPNYGDNNKIGANYVFQESVTLYAKWHKNPSPLWWILFGVLCGVTIIAFAIWYFVMRPKKLF